LKKNPYHIQVFHHLQEEDYPRITAMCTALIGQIESGNLMNKILFSDEATLHTCGKVIDITVAFGQTRNHLIFS
jgi:hypothetical protein